MPPPPDTDPATACRVAVVDRLPLDRELLAHALAHAPGFTVTTAAASLTAGLDAVPDVDVVVVRACAPGTDLRAEVAAGVGLPGRPRVVVVAGYVDAYLVARLREAGADAVASSELPLAAVLDLLRGGSCAPEPVSDRDALGVRHHLTRRELEILDHLADGVAPGQIAHLLGLRISTIRDHVKSLRAKLDCTSATQLVITAHRLGLVPHVGRPLP